MYSVVLCHGFLVIAKSSGLISGSHIVCVIMTGRPAWDEARSRNTVAHIYQHHCLRAFTCETYFAAAYTYLLFTTAHPCWRNHAKSKRTLWKPVTMHVVMSAYKLRAHVLLSVLPGTLCECLSLHFSTFNALCEVWQFLMCVLLPSAN